MKLTTLAIAIAAASLSFSANAADIKFGGDFHVGYKSNDSAANINDYGSELWMNVSQKAGGLTYFGHAELEFRGGIYGDDDVKLVDDVDFDGEDTDTTSVDIDDDITIDELQVGVRGNFGRIIVGDIENACDKLEVGGDWNEFMAASDSRGDCGGEHEGTILYTKKLGKAEIGVSHNVDTDENSAAVRYKATKNVSVALGYIQKKGDTDNIISGSISAKMGKFGLKARVNNGDIGDVKSDGSRSKADENHYSIFGAYSPTKKDLFNVGMDSDDTISVGYKRTLAKNTFLFVEVADFDGKDDGTTGGTEHAIGVQYKF